MKLDAKNFALAAGIFFGLTLSILTLISVYTGFANQLLAIVVNIYPGYQVSLLGVLIGLVYGFVDAFIACYIFAWLYNWLVARGK